MRRNLILDIVCNEKRLHQLTSIMADCYGIGIDEQLALLSNDKKTSAAMSVNVWKKFGYDVPEDKIINVNDKQIACIEDVIPTNDSKDIPMWYYDKADEQDIISIIKNKDKSINANNIDTVIKQYINGKSFSNYEKLNKALKNITYEILCKRLIDKDFKLKNRIDLTNININSISQGLDSVRKTVSTLLTDVKAYLKLKDKCVNYTFENVPKKDYIKDENNIRGNKNDNEQRVVQHLRSDNDIRRTGNTGDSRVSKRSRRLFQSSKNTRYERMGRRYYVNESGNSVSLLRWNRSRKNTTDEVRLSDREQSSISDRTLSGRTRERNESSGVSGGLVGQRNRYGNEPNSRNNDARRDLGTTRNGLVELCRREEERYAQSRGNSNGHSDKQLTFFNNENDKTVDTISIDESTVFLYENLKNVLQGGSNFQNSHIRIQENLKRKISTNEKIEFLKNEYGTGGRSYDFTDGTHGLFSYDKKGLSLVSFDKKYNYNVSWSIALNIIELFINNDMYITKKDIDNDKEFTEKRKILSIINNYAIKKSTDFSVDDTVKFISLLKETAINNKNLQLYAKNNSLSDYGFSYYTIINDILIDTYDNDDKYKDVAGFLLKDDGLLQDLINVFKEDVYNKQKEIKEEPVQELPINNDVDVVNEDTVQADEQTQEEIQVDVEPTIKETPQETNDTEYPQMIHIDVEGGIKGEVPSQREPVCYVTFSENSSFKEDTTYRFDEFNKALIELDEKTHNLKHYGYDKLYYNLMFPSGLVIEDRYDIGDGIGGVIKSLKLTEHSPLGSYLLDYKNKKVRFFYDDQQNQIIEVKYNGDKIEEYFYSKDDIAKANENGNDIVSFFNTLQQSEVKTERYTIGTDEYYYIDELYHTTQENVFEGYTLDTKRNILTKVGILAPVKEENQVEDTTTQEVAQTETEHKTSVFNSPVWTRKKEKVEENVDDLIKVGTQLRLQGKLYTIESINGDYVSMRDEDFYKNVGYPINRREKIDTIRYYFQTQNNEKEELSNFNLIDNPVMYAQPRQRIANNIQAIKTLKKCQAENRQPTEQEKMEMSLYVGWGGLQEVFEPTNSSYNTLKDMLTPKEYSSARESTLTAFYTPDTVSKSIYFALEKFGLRQGKMLEPSCGIGNFIGTMPSELVDNLKVTGVELDSISGNIAKLLYPKANINVKGFEETFLQNDTFDVAVGNVPFGDFKVVDKEYDKYNFMIHDYFFARSLDKLKVGGILAFVTSKGTMDKKSNDVRKYLAKRADLIGAIRLPDDTFKGNANTRVTSDIIFLQKRKDMLEETELPSWVNTTVTEDGYTINNYYVEHPEMIMGKMELVSTRFGFDGACKSDDVSLEEHLNQAVEHLNAKIDTVEKTPTENRNITVNGYVEDVKKNEEEYIDIPTNLVTLKNYAYTVINDKVYQRENNILHLIKDVKEKDIELYKDLTELRDIIYTLIDREATDYAADEDIIKDIQQKLNTQYDKVVSKYSRITNNRRIGRVFKDDPSLPLLGALEEYDKEGNFKCKAAMFTKRTIKPKKIIESCDNSIDALNVVLSERSRVDMDYIKKLTGFTEDKILKDLQGIIYRVPNLDGSVRKYVTADEYLSGEVVDKLKTAKLIKGNTNVEYLDENIKALEMVQPNKLKATDISAKLGAVWIPEKYITQFMQETFKTSAYNIGYIQVQYCNNTDKWEIRGKGYEGNSVSATQVWGTDRMSAYDILEKTLNLQDVVVSDRVYDSEGKATYVENEKETRKAQYKQRLIKEEFKNWIWRDVNRRQDLENIYNDRFNSTIPRRYDGSYLELPGANIDVTFRPHQKDAIARIIQGNNVLLHHCVGAGKTYVMIAAAMESKRIGACNKSIITVPNNIVGQIGKDFITLYPQANILVATEKDFSPANRKKFCSKIATGDYDAIIMGHSQFEKIPLSKATQEEMLQDQLEEILENLRAAKAERNATFTVKELERSKKTIEGRLKKLADIEQDDTITFEQLGVDKLFVDEAHNFKNLFLYTKMSRVAGINSGSESKKASDMYNKVRWLDKETGNKGTVFATGTPISNSMAELYTMQRYLQNDRLKALGLSNFDSWASMFGETVTELELKPEGSGFRMKSRFSKFYNVPELMSIYREMADVKLKEDLNLPLPKVNYENVVCEPSDEQIEMVQNLGERADKIRGKVVDQKEDNMLLVTTDGRKLALDQRIIDNDLPDFENSKVNVCVDNVYDIYKKYDEDKLTQLIFCDLSTPNATGFNVYDDVKKKLIDKGIPENEIAFVHSAKTNKAKEQMFAKVREGAIRVLLGSTQKCGTGTNVQDKLIATHDLDCPWRPSDLEQRAGRIERQGNKNKEVFIYRYVTEKTFDAYMYQTVERKQSSINQAFRGDKTIRELDDSDDQQLNYARLKALATGNPIIEEKMTLDLEVRDLLLQKNSFNAAKFRMEDDIVINIPKKIKGYELLVDNITKDISNLKDELVLDYQGMKLTTPEDIGTLINSLKEEIMNSKDGLEFGTINGLKCTLYYNAFGIDGSIVADIGSSIREYKLGKEKTHMGQKLLNSTDLSMLNTRKEAILGEIDVLQNSLITAKEEVKKEFPQEELLQSKLQRQEELNKMFEDMDEEKQNKKEHENELSNDEKVTSSHYSK